LDGRGYAGLRGAHAAISLERSPMTTGIGCAPLAQSGRARIRANPASLMKHPG
jgi:hypothetical protein